MEIIVVMFVIFGISVLGSWFHIRFWYKPNVLDPLEKYLEERVDNNEQPKLR